MVYIPNNKDVYLVLLCRICLYIDYFHTVVVVVITVRSVLLRQY